MTHANFSICFPAKQSQEKYRNVLYKLLRKITKIEISWTLMFTLTLKFELFTLIWFLVSFGA